MLKVSCASLVFSFIAAAADVSGTKLVHRIKELSSNQISWPLFVAILVTLPMLLVFLGKWSWGRRLRSWADEQGLALVSFRRARGSQRTRMASAFGEWDSDWLEVFVVVVDTKGRERRTGLVTFKSWFGIGPYRFREIRWIG